MRWLRYRYPGGPIELGWSPILLLFFGAKPAEISGAEKSSNPDAMDVDVIGVAVPPEWVVDRHHLGLISPNEPYQTLGRFGEVGPPERVRIVVASVPIIPESR